MQKYLIAFTEYIKFIARYIDDSAFPKRALKRKGKDQKVKYRKKKSGKPNTLVKSVQGINKSIPICLFPKCMATNKLKFLKDRTECPDEERRFCLKNSNKNVK